MEKQLHLTKINAKFIKDFDTFGKMDPFLVFKIGKSQTKTQTANSQGKNPVWNTQIILAYLDETTINITAYEQDTMSNDFMGIGTADLKALKQSGTLQIKIQDKGQFTGTVFAQYTLKELAPSPFVLIRNIKCDFYKQTKFILKAMPYFSLACGSNNMVTDIYHQKSGRKLFWNQTLRVKINQTNPIILSLLDKNNNGSELFQYLCKVDQFKTTNGRKQYYVNDNTFEPLGIVSFEYETLNIVNQLQSAKVAQKIKQQQNQMTKITIEKIRGNLQKDGIDVYFKILCGPNIILTNTINSAPKNFEMTDKMVFYAQNKENNITLALWDKNYISDDVVGFGSLSIPISAGEKEILLTNRNGDNKGSMFVTISVQKIPIRSITFQNIRLNMLQKGDIIGSSEPFIIARIGGWSGRTETAQGQNVTFQTSLHLKYNDEQEIIFQVWDQDIASHDKLFEEKYQLSKLKSSSGQLIVPLGSNKGQINMKYKTKNYQHVNTPQSTDKTEKKTIKEDRKQILQQPQEENRQRNREINKVGEAIFKIQQEEQKHQNTLVQKKQSCDILKLEVKNPHDSNRSSVNNQKHNEADTILKVQQTKQNKLAGKNQTNNKQNMSVNHLEVQNQNYKQQNCGIGQSSINKSKSTFKLPAIEHRNFGDKIFEKQSSSTLQKSIHVYSIPKATRFGQGPKYAGQPSYYVETCFKNNTGRGAGFGFGNKRQFPQWLQKNMKQNPAPGAYFETRANLTDYHSKGPTFGLGHKYYSKVMIPKQKTMTQKYVEKIKYDN